MSPLSSGKIDQYELINIELNFHKKQTKKSEDEGKNQASLAICRP